MKTYNMHEAKTQFSKLVSRVEQGEEILIARDGSAVARLVAEKRPARKPGRLQGRLTVRKGFDDPLPDEILSAFGGVTD